MLSSIWKWIKRIMFVAVMVFSLGCSISMFEETKGVLDIVLNCILLILSLGSCVLYFMFNEYKKRPIVIALTGLIGISIYLTISVEANIYPLCTICGFLGLVISCGVKWIGKAIETVNGN